MSDEILVSIVIPVKNGAGWLDETIPSILAQEVNGAIEIIVIDSGSTDETLSILSKYPVKVVSIDPATFNHGLTRNMGAGMAKGKFVVMTVQDARPSSSKWLQFLMDGFVDENVAGVCGQQVVPHEPDKNPVEWFRPVSKPNKRRIEFSNPSDYNLLNAAGKQALCGWDDVNTMYRKNILMSTPFRRTAFGEDAQWAQDILRQGYAIVFNTEAQVYHYHHETYDYTFKRTIAVLYMRYRTFEFLPAKSSLTKRVKVIGSNIKTLIREHSVSWPDKVKWLKYNLNKQRATRDALKIFYEAIDAGEAAVDKLYYTVCEKIPMATKSSLIV